MRLTFLGTSAGSPTFQRNVTGLALAREDSRDWYLVDCGEGTQHQLLHCRYSASRLQAIFITHVHGDHCYGLPGLITSANTQGRTRPLTVCAPDGIEQFIRATFTHTDVRPLRFELNFIRSDLPEFHWQDEHFQVDALPLSHRVPCFGYRFTERPPYHLDETALDQQGVPRGPLWKTLQQGQNIVLQEGREVQAEQVRRPAWPARRAIICGDNDRPDWLIPALQDSDLLVHEATFTEDVLARVGPQYMHSTAAMVAKAAATANLPHLILTHFSQRYRHSKDLADNQRHIHDLRDEAAAIYPGDLHLAEDFASFQLERDHRLSPLGNARQR